MQGFHRGFDYSQHYWSMLHFLHHIKMEEVTKAVEAFTLEQGADIVGIGSAEVMNMEASKLQTPEKNLPGAKAVVSFGMRMLNSIFKSPNIRISLASYVYFQDSLDDIAWKVAGFLEDNGFDAIPITSDVPVEIMEKGGLLGDISHRHAAVQAGLGRVELSQHFLSLRFGPWILGTPFSFAVYSENSSYPLSCAIFSPLFTDKLIPDWESFNFLDSSAILIPSSFTAQ